MYTTRSLPVVLRIRRKKNSIKRFPIAEWYT